jgi:hypothetical protein
MRVLNIRHPKTELADLCLVKAGQLIQQSFTVRQKEYPHDPLVTYGPAFADKPAALGPLDESHDGVVALLEEFGQFGDRGPAPARKSCNTKKQLVLLWCKTIRAGGSFTEAQKLSKLVTEVCQLAEVWKTSGCLGMGRNWRALHGVELYHTVI